MEKWQPIVRMSYHRTTKVLHNFNIPLAFPNQSHQCSFQARKLGAQLSQLKEKIRSYSAPFWFSVTMLWCQQENWCVSFSSSRMLILDSRVIESASQKLWWMKYVCFSIFMSKRCAAGRELLVVRIEGFAFCPHEIPCHLQLKSRTSKTSYHKALGEESKSLAVLLRKNVDQNPGNASTVMAHWKAFLSNFSSNVC